MELSKIRGIGEKTISELNSNDIYTAEDLYKSLPKKYDTYKCSEALPLQDEEMSLRMYVDSAIVSIPFRTTRGLLFYGITDFKARVKVVAFGKDYLRYQLKKGLLVIANGKYKKAHNELTLTHIFLEDFEVRIIPEYKYKHINDGNVLRYIEEYLKLGNPALEEDLPLELVNKYRLLPINEYYYKAHFPKTIEDLRQVNRRKKYKMFFDYCVKMQYLKNSRSVILKNPVNVNVRLIDEFISKLPFDLTTDQKTTVDTIIKEIQSEKRMNRLVQGDVSSGKSIVAFIAALATISGGKQACLMAPTEILAQQHYIKAKALFEPFGFKVALLTSSVKEKEKRIIIEHIRTNKVDFIIGTHSLIESSVVFKQLALCIIDEQQRFGVDQRAKLIAKCMYADCLYLTATPIPRTLGLTEFGDLDLSSIKTKPFGRQKVRTIIIDKTKIEKIFSEIGVCVAANRQVYVVCPKIEDDNNGDVFDIKKAFDFVNCYVDTKIIGILHGKMSAEEKAEVMKKFINKEYQILISTTVIEVGVDVKDVNDIFILDAERFGLSTLHQLRGRVGRGSVAASCYLVSRNPDDEKLKALENTSDGFEIATKDFLIRGPGDYFGTAQSGIAYPFQLDFSLEYKIYECAKADAAMLISKYYNHEKVDDCILKIVCENVDSKKIN